MFAFFGGILLLFQKAISPQRGFVPKGSRVGYHDDKKKKIWVNSGREDMCTAGVTSIIFVGVFITLSLFQRIVDFNSENQLVIAQ